MLVSPSHGMLTQRIVDFFCLLQMFPCVKDVWEGCCECSPFWILWEILKHSHPPLESDFLCQTLAISLCFNCSHLTIHSAKLYFYFNNGYCFEEISYIFDPLKFCVEYLNYWEIYMNVFWWFAKSSNKNYNSLGHCQNVAIWGNQSTPVKKCPLFFVFEFVTRLILCWINNW